MRSRLTGLLALSVLALACRPTPGEPDYPDITPYQDTDVDGNLPGDDPWDGGSPRLSLSAFYEGGASDVILIDDETVHYYIYEGSFSQQTSAERVEGFESDEITVSAATFWGGGVHLDEPQDLSAWDTLHVALRSDDPELEAFQLGMVGSAAEGRASVTSYGFAADGEWHVLNIPLAELTPSPGLDSVSVALLLISPTATPGTSILIDDLYFTAQED